MWQEKVELTQLRTEQLDRIKQLEQELRHENPDLVLIAYNYEEKKNPM